MESFWATMTGVLEGVLLGERGEGRVFCALVGEDSRTAVEE